MGLLFVFFSGQNKEDLNKSLGYLIKNLMGDEEVIIKMKNNWNGMGVILPYLYA